MSEAVPLRCEVSGGYISHTCIADSFSSESFPSIFAEEFGKMFGRGAHSSSLLHLIKTAGCNKDITFTFRWFSTLGEFVNSTLETIAMPPRIRELYQVTSSTGTNGAGYAIWLFHMR